ncbi:MAG: heme exporter protein CcmB [Acidimicrobiia bacterium]|nr:MAG: heme exporter protein CcmB [Acidimicrobiia bacterium]
MRKPTVTPGFFHQALTITRRDLLRERRSGEVMWVTLPFGAIALLLVPLAIGTDAPTLQRIGPGMFWVIVMLFGVLIAIRQTNAETTAQRDLVALTGLDPAAIFVGKAVASFLLLLVFEAVLGVVTIALYDVELIGWVILPVVLVLAAAGLALLGTLAAGIVATGRSGAALVPLLVAPMSVPILLGATQALDAIRLDRSSISWVLMMTIVVLLLAVVGVLSSRPLQETG